MKKIFKVGMIVYFLIFNHPAFAASLGDSILPSGDRFVITVEDNYIFSKGIEDTGTITDFEMKDLNQFYVKISRGFTDLSNIYAKLGISDMGDIDQKDSGSLTREVEADTGFFWGGGISGAFEIFEKTFIGLDLQINSWRSNISGLRENGVLATGLEGEIVNWDFQGAGFLSKVFEMERFSLVLYGGGIASLFKTKTHDDNITYSISGTGKKLSWNADGDNNLGAFTGLVIGSHDLPLRLGIEGRFISETSLSVSGSFKF